MESFCLFVCSFFEALPNRHNNDMDYVDCILRYLNHRIKLAVY